MTEKTAPKPRKRRAVSIASGAHVPHIDLDALFRAGHGADTMASAAAAPLEGAAMTGGGIQTANATAPDATLRAGTVALPDGTRITFAAPDWVRTLETA